MSSITISTLPASPTDVTTCSDDVEESKPAPDIFEASGKQTIFDGDAKKQKMSDQDYQKAFGAADDRYSQILTALLAQVKKTS